MQAVYAAEEATLETTTEQKESQLSEDKESVLYREKQPQQSEEEEEKAEAWFTIRIIGSFLFACVWVILMMTSELAGVITVVGVILGLLILLVRAIFIVLS